jgi:hypothetical protein
MSFSDRRSILRDSATPGNKQHCQVQSFVKPIPGWLAARLKSARVVGLMVLSRVLSPCC